MQFCEYKRNSFISDSCYGFSLDLCQATNHELSSQLVLGAGVIGWFCFSVSFGHDSFGFRRLSA